MLDFLRKTMNKTYTENGAVTYETTGSDCLDLLNATWNSLPDFGGDENALAVIDTSGSMYWGQKVVPATVALSLGLSEGSTRQTYHNIRYGV